MGYIVDQYGDGRIVTKEKNLNAEELGMASSLTVPQVFSTITILFEEQLGNRCEVKPRVNLTQAPIYNQKLREPTNLPGWQVDIRKQLFDGISKNM
jgi:hypothetical protein